MKKLGLKRTLGSLLAVVLSLALVACTVDQVLSDIDVVIQIAGNLGAAVGQVSPADAAIITVFTGIATSGIQAIQAAYDTYKKSGATTDLQKLLAIISAVQANLAQELAAAHVSDPASQQKVTAWVNLIATSVDAIVAALPQLNSPASLTAKRTIVATAVPTPETLQARWAAEVCKGDLACGKKVKAHRHWFNKVRVFRKGG